MKNIVLAIAILFMQSCATNFMDALSKPKLTKNDLGDDYSAPTNQLNKTRELLDGASITFPTLTATGYAVVSTQPGQNIEQRRLMAIRAARMSAMRE